MALRNRIKVTPRDGLPGGTQVAKVELADGRRLTVSHDAYQPLGNVALQKDLVAKKFYSLAEPVIGKAIAAELHRLVYELPRAKSVVALTQRAAAR